MAAIREEEPGDAEAVRRVNERAFLRAEEATLVDRLRASCDNLLSLVAEVDGRVVGHIMFSPVVLEADVAETVEGMGLAPMAVLPEFQRQGIGSALAREGLDRLEQAGCPFVIVLGHPGYYPRFGFVPASGRGIRCQWNDVPDDVFMVLILDEARLAGLSGVARYRREFDEAL